MYRAHAFTGLCAISLYCLTCFRGHYRTSAGSNHERGPRPTKSVNHSYFPFDTSQDVSRSGYGWRSDKFTRWHDWFFYFDNMGNLSSSPFAQNYFRLLGFDLEPFKDAEGVWVAYNYTGPWPIFGKPYPTLSAVTKFHWYHMTIRCYLHGSAEIWVDGVKWFPPNTGTIQSNSSESTWVIYNRNITVQTKSVFQLRVPNEEDFILLDKIDLVARTS